jgi:hypothetical protein
MAISFAVAGGDQTADALIDRFKMKLKEMDAPFTDLAESGAGDETIRDITGHVSKQMLKHYSHIRMEAKRRALESIVAKPKTEATSDAGPDQNEPVAPADEALHRVAVPVIN